MNTDKSKNNSANFRKHYPVNADYTCQLSDTKRDETIDQYVNNALSPEKRDAFDEHTFYCETCFRELRFREEMAEALAQKAAAPAKSRNYAAQKFSLPSVLDAFVEWLTPPRYIPITIGAVALILIAVLGINYLQQDNLGEQRRLFAANAAPYARYERLIDSFRRAGAITVLSPENNFNCQEDLLFEWQREGGGTLYIKIFSNKDELQYTFTTEENRYLFENAGEKLQPGLYYWKLEDEEEMKYVGKFFVKKPD
ncbi:MAG: hypothetical protein ACE5I1_14030 [bacterium]